MGSGVSDCRFMSNGFDHVGRIRRVNRSLWGAEVTSTGSDSSSPSPQILT